MTITKFSCSNCGSGRLVHIENNRYECEYCNTVFFVETDKKGHLKNVSVSGMNQESFQVFAIHEELIVSGMKNIITVLSTSEQAKHVAKLAVSGMDNKVSVVLCDGAGYSTSGMDNQIVHV